MLIHSCHNLCCDGYYSRASVGNRASIEDLAWGWDEVLANEKKVQALVHPARKSAYPSLNASGGRKSGVVHEPHVNLSCSSTPLAVQVSTQSDWALAELVARCSLYAPDNQ
jgi:hypothetical protein